MTYISQVVLGISAAAIFVGAMFMLAPSGNLSKSVRYVFTLVFLCVCITFFLKIGNREVRFVLDEPETDYTTAHNLTSIQAEKICSAALDDNNISYEKISVSTDINESDGIFISNVRIVSDDDAELIRTIINQTVMTKEVTVE